MKKLLLSLVLFSGAAFAADCTINFGPYTIPTTTPFSDNRFTGCVYWVMTYQVTGFSAISLQFESATGASTPGAFGAYSGTVTTGVNPSVSVACATPANCTAVFTGAVGWYRVNLITATGAGTVRGTLQGYKTGVPLGGNAPPSGTSCPGTAASPCVVDGPTAAGSPPTLPPVMVAGQDGTNIRTIKTDTAGQTQVTQTTPAQLQTQVTGAAANAAPLAGNPVTVCGSDGTNCRLILVDTSGRVIVVGAAADGSAITGNPVVQGVDDGTNARYVRSASLGNYPTVETLTAVNSVGAQIVEKGSRWTATGFPAAAAQATATIAAEASVRHVLDCIGFSATSSAAVTAQQINLVVRDGATGAGTVIWRYTLAVPTVAAAGAVEIPPFSFCGLNLVGTTNTAMTVEFSAGITGVQEQTNFSGFNVN